MARNEQLIRQHKILQILERVRYGKTLKELSDDLVEELGLASIHQRTIRRDLEALQAAGIDVDNHDEQRGKVWKLGPRAKTTTQISCSATELIALSLGRQLMHPLVGTPFWMGIETFWQKIQEDIPDGVLSHYGLLEIVYQSMGKPAKTRLIEPYEMCLHKSSLYVIGAANEVEDPETRVRVWKLDRFEKAKLLDTRFKPPEDLDLDNFFGNTLSIFRSNEDPRDFVIRVDAVHASSISEDPWHPEQEIKKLDNGDVQLTIPDVTHELEIMPRVLALGHEAEILKPEEIRKSAHCERSNDDCMRCKLFGVFCGDFCQPDHQPLDRILAIVACGERCDVDRSKMARSSFGQSLARVGSIRVTDAMGT